jgi:hypothetical protein
LKVSNLSATRSAKWKKFSCINLEFSAIKSFSAEALIIFLTSVSVNCPKVSFERQMKENNKRKCFIIKILGLNIVKLFE